MTAGRNVIEDAVEQALDPFVYAPIGLLFDGPARYKTLVRNGRNQVGNARMMGQFAVQMGRTELEKRTAELDGPVVDLLRGLGVVPGAVVPEPPAPAPDPVPEPAKATTTDAPPPAAAEEAAAQEAVEERNAATDAATPAVEALPITDYDSLSASQVVSRLRGLAPGQLEAVRAYESATRGRKTILNRIQQLSKS